jgi:hypothetical protein
VATIGGKTRGPPASWCVGQASESISREPRRPLSYDPSRQTYLATDHRQRSVIGHHQNHLCSNDVAMRHDQGAGDVFEHDALGGLQYDLDWWGLAALGLHPTGLIMPRSADPVFG